MLPDHDREITEAAGLELPEEIIEVMESLSEGGRQSFIRELLGAIARAQRTNNLASVQKVIDAWYSSRLFAHRIHEQWPEESVASLLVWSEKVIADEEPMTAKEVRAFLDV